MTTSPYAISLAALVDGAHVPVAEQVTEQAAPRLEHLPGNPVLWTANLAAAGGFAGGAGGGFAGGAGGGGGCDGGGGGC